MTQKVRGAWKIEVILLIGDITGMAIVSLQILYISSNNKTRETKKMNLLLFLLLLPH